MGEGDYKFVVACLATRFYQAFCEALQGILHAKFFFIPFLTLKNNYS